MRFPVLQSGVIAQDWAEKIEETGHSEYWFGGMKRQAIQNSPGEKILWRLRYRDLLSEEAMQLRGFVESLSPEDVFEFIDPWTGILWDSCRLGTAPFLLQCSADFRWTASLEVENAR